jgi:uncharacterized repeat protein (TIGR03803 family)
MAFLLVATASWGDAQTLQTLYYFNGGDGKWPSAALTLGSDGNLYGVTEQGGYTNLNNKSGFGTVFKVTTNGALTTLASFNGTNGYLPEAGLTLGSDGNFYGTTSFGGSPGGGTVFKVTTNGILTTLVSFSGLSNGETPNAALTAGSNGNFYGTTFGGGSGPGIDQAAGTLFKVSTNGVLTTLVLFNITNGASPNAALTMGNDGNFYGTTEEGGTTNKNILYGASPWVGQGFGTVFKVTTNGTLTTLVFFNGANGQFPMGALTLGSDGNFYGTTLSGGNTNLNSGNGYGTVFKVTTNGALTTLFSFTGTNGWGPQAGLTMGSDGNFYGTTEGGGDNLMGNIFKVTTNGSITTLASFSITNGDNPTTALTFGSDGNLYGTTQLGGNNNNGTVFRLLLPVPAGIAIQPQNITNYVGSTATFSVSVTGSQPFSIHWQRNSTNLVNGGNISGATNSILTITSISDGDATTYSVIVTNLGGVATSSNATLTVLDSPFIATQPQSQTVGAGSNVTLSATAYGAQPLIFQWYYNGSPVGTPTVGANVSFYNLTNVQTNQSGIYTVQVLNGYDSATSSNAILTVFPTAPNITAQPISQRVVSGGGVSFNVAAIGTAPIHYQWFFNNGLINNATNAIYAIQVISTNNTGYYSVVVSNIVNSVTSSNALLTVLVPPTVGLHFLAGYPQLNLNGIVSNNFTVQYNTNLTGTNWVNLRSISNLSSSPYQFLDPAGSGQPARFYRAFMQ